MKEESASSEIAKAINSSSRHSQARFRRIAESLRNAILSGAYQPGDQLPTEMELAREHNVSRVTAAAALTELAREGLVTRAPRRGTVVRHDVETARRPSRAVVAWIVDSVEATFGLGVLRGVQLGVRESDFSLLLAYSGDNQEDETRAILDAVASGASGIMIFIHDGESYNAEVLRLVLRGYPVVLVDRYLRGVSCATVSSDNFEGSRMLVQELLEAGHRHICVVSFPPRDTSTIEDRMRGYVQALTDASVPVDYSLHHVVSRADARTSWAVEAQTIDDFVAFLEAHPDVTAIYATNAFVGLVAYRAIERMELRLPEDMSLVCIDPLEAIPLSLPAVTAGVQRGEEIGRTAVRLLREVMAGEPPRTVLLPMDLQRAGTVGPAPSRVSLTAVADDAPADEPPDPPPLDTVWSQATSSRGHSR